MTGFVTGPAGEDVHTDEMGRVKVIFPWDRRQPADDRCSDWIPVLQDNTGHSVGVPRVGLAKTPVDSADVFLYHKTTRRQVYERARRE
jgi:hypothetical protein